MAPSAERLGVGLVTVSVAVTAGLVLGGCETTQEAAARIKVRSARTIESREPVRIRERATDIEVLGVTPLTSADGTAVVVTLENTSSATISDRPILVGVRTKEGRRYLNDGKNVPYFQSHGPALAPGQTGTWVYANKDETPGIESAFAEVGAAGPERVTDATTATAVPEIDVGEVTLSEDQPKRARVTVTNRIGFPQFDLTVFVWATKGDRVVAAGRAFGGDLEPDEVEPLTVKLIGDPAGAELHVSAPPTIYQ